MEPKLFAGNVIDVVFGDDFEISLDIFTIDGLVVNPPVLEHVVVVEAITGTNSRDCCRRARGKDTVPVAGVEVEKEVEAITLLLYTCC